MDELTKLRLEIERTKLDAIRSVLELIAEIERLICNKKP